jgi:hypothetical protein
VGAEPIAWQTAHRGFVRIAWLMPLALTLQEAEEWKWDIIGYCHAQFGVPRPSVAHPGVVMFVAVLIGWLWTYAAMRARTAARAAFAILPFALIGFERWPLNVYWAARTPAYIPGMMTSLILLGPASLLLVRRAWRDGLVSHRYVATLAVIALLNFGNWVIRPEASLTQKMVGIERIDRALTHLVGQ